jgi:hypothetical protein
LFNYWQAAFSADDQHQISGAGSLILKIKSVKKFYPNSHRRRLLGGHMKSSDFLLTSAFEMAEQT